MNERNLGWLNLKQNLQTFYQPLVIPVVREIPYVNDYLALSICSTVCGFFTCCWCIGIIDLFKSLQVKNKVYCTLVTPLRVPYIKMF